MICTKKEFIRTDADGTKWWQVVLTSDTDPDTLNLTGADVENLNDALGLAAGSILITPTANYIAFEDGVFTAKGEGGGGGGGGNVTVEIYNSGELNPVYGAYGESMDIGTMTQITIEQEQTETLTVPSGTYFGFDGDVTDTTGSVTEIPGTPTFYQVNSDATITVEKPLG